MSTTERAASSEKNPQGATMTPTPTTRTTPTAATTATATNARAGETLLLEFLREHDAACPVCGYNLRGLTRTVCPECKQDLVLTVGATSIRFGWLIVALAPGFFSGIAACFLAIPVTAAYVDEGVIIPPLLGALLFGFLSGVFALVLARQRLRFIALPRSRQRWIALGVWGAHVAAFALFVVSMAALI